MEGIGRVPNMYNYLVSYCSFVQTFSLALNPFHPSFSSLGLPLFSFALCFLTSGCLFYPPQTKPFFCLKILCCPLSWCPAPSRVISLQHQGDTRRQPRLSPSLPLAQAQSRHEQIRSHLSEWIVIKSGCSRLLLKI